MKKIFILFTAVLLTAGINAQVLISGTIANSAAPNTFTVHGKTATGFTDRLMDNIIVTFSFVDQGAGNNPTPTIGTNYLAILGWSQVANFAQGGRIYYVFTGVSNPSAVTPTTTWTPNSNNKIIDFTMSNNNGFGTLRLEDLTGDPGEANSAYWYFQIRTLGDVTNYSSKFYGTGAVNNSATPSLVPLQATLPAFFGDFNVLKQGNTDALLTWSTLFEQNVSHFVVERSLSQTGGWSRFAEVKAKGNSNTPSKYSYTDAKVYDGRDATKVVFYRIRAIDYDSKETVFPVRSLRFSVTGNKQITIYPNPAKDGFYLSIPLITNDDRPIKLSLVNRLGQLVHTREISSTLASNYYYDIKTPGVISGEYMLQIIYNGDLLETKKVIVNR